MHIHSMVGPPQGLPRPHPECILGTNTARALQVQGMEETDSTEVKYKIRQWSLPGATIVPVLVSSRVFWLELDDKALLDSYAVLQKLELETFVENYFSALQHCVKRLSTYNPTSYTLLSGYITRTPVCPVNPIASMLTEGLHSPTLLPVFHRTLRPVLFLGG